MAFVFPPHCVCYHSRSILHFSAYYFVFAVATTSNHLILQLQYILALVSIWLRALLFFFSRLVQWIVRYCFLTSSFSSSSSPSFEKFTLERMCRAFFIFVVPFSDQKCVCATPVGLYSICLAFLLSLSSRTLGRCCCCYCYFEWWKNKRHLRKKKFVEHSIA